MALKVGSNEYSVTQVISGVVGVLTIIGMLFSALVFLDSRYVDASTMTAFRAEQVDSEVDDIDREVRQLEREKRRVPAAEKHYYDDDIKKLFIQRRKKEKRKQNILEGVE